jgi:hypothetical protein
MIKSYRHPTRAATAIVSELESQELDNLQIREEILTAKEIYAEEMAEAMVLQKILHNANEILSTREHSDAVARLIHLEGTAETYRIVAKILESGLDGSKLSIIQRLRDLFK